MAQWNISLSDEPSGGVSAFMHIQADTNLEAQEVGFELDLPENVYADMRVMQFVDTGEEYVNAVAWTSITSSGAQSFMVPINKAYVKAGGPTMLQMTFRTVGNVNLGTGTATQWKNYYTYLSHYVSQTHIATICEEKDNYRFGFNGMEKDNEAKGIGNSLDFGARIYDSRLGRWLSCDALFAKYPAISPYTFAVNSPILAKDPDGNVVLFINGQHAGSGGSASYWGGYDKKIMNRIGDHSARYIDGALGGWKNTGANASIGAAGGGMAFGWVGASAGAVIEVARSSNVNMKVRMEAGKLQGYKDAQSIIANLSEGESIKIVTHSMGTAFSRGYVAGLMEYANTHQVKLNIEYQLDVNAFQGGDLKPSKFVKTTDTKKGGLDGGNSLKEMLQGNSVPTVDKVPGANDKTDDSDDDKGHSVSEMSVSGVPNLGNSGTSSHKPIEQGNNNANAR